MVDDIGQRGDVAVAALLLDAHGPDRCRDCAAGRCETGDWVDRQLAPWRRDRAAALTR